jgi:hypothetical protein
MRILSDMFLNILKKISFFLKVTKKHSKNNLNKNYRLNLTLFWLYKIGNLQNDNHTEIKNL